MKQPLSPHIQIYKRSLLMMASITHRLTGAFLSLGVLIFVGWLLALFFGGGVYDCFEAFVHSIVGKIFLFALVWALFQHLFGGIKHLLWDADIFLDVKCAHAASMVTFGLSIVCTLVLFVL